MDTALARPLGRSTSEPADGVRTSRGLAGAHWYKRLQAWMAAQGSPRYERLVAGTKSALLSPLEGTVLEIGPGGGANLPFLRGDVRWIGVEPNPFAHRYLHDVADRLGLDAEVRLGTAERLPVPDRSVDAVVGSLVLCSVRDPAAALREVRRVLRPGGRYVFVEHVAAHHGRPLRFLQRLMRPAWRALGDGCHPDRDTGKLIASAGFAGVVQRPFELPIPVVGPHVAGLAWV